MKKTLIFMALILSCASAFAGGKDFKVEKIETPKTSLQLYRFTYFCNVEDKGGETVTIPQREKTTTLEDEKILLSDIQQEIDAIDSLNS